MSEPATSAPRRAAGAWLMALPLIGFLALAGLFLLRLQAAIPRKFPRP